MFQKSLKLVRGTNLCFGFQACSKAVIPILQNGQTLDPNLSNSGQDHSSMMIFAHYIYVCHVIFRYYLVYLFKNQKYREFLSNNSSSVKVL